MPKLHYSNRLDRLIGPLAQNLELEDPFEKAEIVVPNFSLQKWISLQLAQRVGIAANLRFLPLEGANNLGGRYGTSTHCMQFRHPL